MRVRADWFFEGFAHNTQRDRVDGLGSLRVIDRYTLVLLVVGTLVAVRRWRRSTSVLTFLALALIFVAAVTTYDGLYRRTFGMTPFLCLIAAAPLAEIWRIAEGSRPRVAAPLFAFVGVILVLFVSSNISLHRKSTTTEWLHWLYMPETVAAVEYMGDVDGDPYVYFYSERISIKHDVPRYLAPDREGIDRSLEFDTNGAVLQERGQGPELRPSRAGDSLYVFLGAYLQQPLQDVQRMYPGGTLYEGRDDEGQVIFAAYRVDIETPPGG
jgi:hypothetical protein